LERSEASSPAQQRRLSQRLESRAIQSKERFPKIRSIAASIEPTSIEVLFHPRLKGDAA
jgi:hypothetical protein